MTSIIRRSPSRGMRTVLLVVGSYLFLTGCAASRGFNRGQLRMHVGQPQEINDKLIAEVLSRKPQLPHPFRLGVYFEEEKYWHLAWTNADQALVLDLGRKL